MELKQSGRFVLTLSVLLCSSLAVAQNHTLPRPFTPVVFQAGELPFVGEAIDSLVLYRYTPAEGWTRIPFQIDEVNNANGKYEPEDGVIDANDELVFMARDAGSPAEGDGNFAPEAGVDRRWKIEVHDPLSATTAYVYLFKKTGNEAEVDGYMGYTADAAGAGADTILTSGYVQGHGQTGWIESVQIVQNGSIGADIVDRQKLRVKGTIRIPFFNQEYEANEAESLEFDSVRVQVGPVRIFRRLFLRLIPPFQGLPPIHADLEFQYFPYSSIVSAKNAEIDSAIANLAGIELIRQSIDLNAQATGMQFYNDSNLVGITVDGVADTPKRGIPVSPEIAFLAVNGAQGMLLNIIEVPALGDSQQLYYHDDASGSASTADGTTDTGDNSSYGDFGVQINGSKIRGRVSLDFFMYYLPQQADPVAMAQRIRSETTTPLEINAVLEVNNPSHVLLPEATPANYLLYDAHPNPYTPGHDVVRIAFELKAPASTLDVTVYNLLGQVVTKLAEGSRFSAGQHTLRWNGRNRFGRLVPQGVYFYAIEGRFGRHVKKLVLVR